ncbi:MAG: hypothetical protein QF879_22260 [Candidatus Latescibacteria bacterium]|nr:hypothetical protein [Candidatus Latescibacterota bacterium]
MEQKDQIDKVDFNHSTLYWGGPSQGVFKLISLLNDQTGADESSNQTYGLSQSVMAGNMYVEDNLLKQPPYLFQVAGSIQEQRIFRSFIPDRAKRKLPTWMKKNLTGDTHSKRLFDEFGLNIIREKATPVSTFDEIDAVFLENGFSAKVMATFEDKSVCLEFPVNHMNVKRETRQWQVETGPILIPVMGGNGGAFDYLPAFVHFNSFDKMDIFHDYPFGYRSLDLLNKGILSSVPCNIKLFV